MPAGDPASAAALTAPPGPLPPIAGGGPGLPPDQGPDWGAIQQKEGAQQASHKVDHAAEDARIEALKKEYDLTETISGKFTQGALDALLAPGALVGAATESAGDLFRNKAIRDFGRGLGDASTGKSAMSALAGLAIGAEEGSALAGAHAMDDAAERLEKAEEARPMLATISRLAGMSGIAVGMGAGAAGESSALASIAANAAEGAAGGAQSAYEHAAPLRDVLTSAAIGGVLGGTVAAAGEGVQKLIKKAPDLTNVFSEKMQDTADQFGIGAVIRRDRAGWRRVEAMAPERKARLADRIRDADVLGKGDEGMLEGLTQKGHQVNEELSAFANRLDAEKVPANISKMEADIAEQIGELKNGGTHTMQKAARKLELEMAPFRKKLAITQPDQFGNEMVVGYRNPGFQELRKFKNDLGNSIDWNPELNDPINNQMKKMWRTVSDGLSDAADNAGPGLKQQWKDLNETASDFIELQQSLKKQMALKSGQRKISLTDYMSGISGGLAMTIMGANPVAALGTLAAGAIGHKLIREGGSALLSNLTNRFARMSRRVPLARAGGPEAQEVLSALSSTKAFMEDTAARAGANPTTQQAAREAAKQVASEQLLKKAGKFDPAAWAEKPLSPLQKTLYRTQILDTVSTDLSKVAEHTATLHPELPATLDVRRVGRLMGDAKGTEALGSLQQLVRESSAALPETPTGDAAGQALRNLGLSLERLEPAEAMAKTHEIANWFAAAAEHAPDDMSKAFANRTEQALRESLSSENWGSAGKAYGQMVAAPHEVLGQMASPEALRDVLRSGDVSAAAGAFRQAQDRVSASWDGLHRLTGEQRPVDLGKTMSAAHRLLEAAESAVTIDGKPIARLFDAANVSSVYAGAEAVNAGTVQEHVETGLDHIKPMLTGDTVKAAGSMTIPHEVTREEYDKRIKQLTQSVAQPDQMAGTVTAAIAPTVGQALTQLLKDMPKPTNTVHGKVMDTMSQDDLRLANAMWEATTEPLSVLTDLASGSLDPDKANYAWKQYPGLQRAVQAGVMDDLMGLTDEQRSLVPDHVLTQLDSAIGFNGTLQDANEPSFAARMSKLYQPGPPKPQPGGMLQTPEAEPTFTDRLAGNT